MKSQFSFGWSLCLIYLRMETSCLSWWTVRNQGSGTYSEVLEGCSNRSRLLQGMGSCLLHTQYHTGWPFKKLKLGQLDVLKYNFISISQLLCNYLSEWNVQLSKPRHMNSDAAYSDIRNKSAPQTKSFQV